jgi:hypothetical protein
MNAKQTKQKKPKLGPPVVYGPKPRHWQITVPDDLAKLITLVTGKNPRKRNKAIIGALRMFFGEHPVIPHSTQDGTDVKQPVTTTAIDAMEDIFLRADTANTLQSTKLYSVKGAK